MEKFVSTRRGAILTLFVLAALLFSHVYYFRKAVLLERTVKQIAANYAYLQMENQDLTEINECIAADSDFWLDMYMEESRKSINVDPNIVITGDSVVFNDDYGLLDFEVRRDKYGHWQLNTWRNEYEYDFGYIYPKDRDALSMHVYSLPVSNTIKDMLYDIVTYYGDYEGPYFVGQHPAYIYHDDVYLVDKYAIDD